MTEKSGIVYLVGAGPGDPGLITLRAVECLGQADVVLYDYLANPAALEHAPKSAELVSLGDHRGGRIMSADEVIQKTIDEASSGKTVVRLKGGDPSVFGRSADEVAALRQAHIKYEIVPGITAALAAAAYCEIPITHHNDASAVVFVAGRERRGKPESKIDYEALAKFPGTIVFYMGVTRASVWSHALIEHGMKPDTPLAIIRWCTWPKQEVFHTTLCKVAEFVEEKQLRPPALFIVGDAVQHMPKRSWFMDKSQPSC